jgi:hypothetical protein
VERVGEHPTKSGPIAARWLAYELEAPRAGATGLVRVVVENAGSATWRSRGRTGVRLAYHWLDPLGNPIVWDGVRTALDRPIAPGERAAVDLAVVAPRPPGAYVLSLDLLEEFRFWFAEVGSTTLDVPVRVAPRIAERRLAVVVHGGVDPETAAALARQDDPIVDEDATAVAHVSQGAAPAPDWSRRLLDAHEEGWPAVGGAVDAGGGIGARSRRRQLQPWAPGGGRNPRFALPLLFPSLLEGLEPVEHLGFPAYTGEDVLFDGRAVVTLRPRSGRRPA